MAENGLPELLAPAGSPDALRAAVAGGADAVYFGAKSFSARSFAENFDDTALCDAVDFCRAFGVKSYLAVNIGIYEKELASACELIKHAYEAGADAFIVSDLGLARIIHENYPEIELHASTQMSGQNVLSAKILAGLGFSRMVAPREIPRDALKLLCENSPIETEVFIHGALCVSHSGQCLFSSVIGGRSGNRGECAQPCRLEYDCKNCRYPLSLKDLCLAGKVCELTNMGVSSLKIEGRMKSPDYVYGVTSVYRRLLDEGRDATEDEFDALSKLFSRSGFTCGYYTGNIDRSMLGVRTAADKRASTQSAGAAIPERKIPIKISAKFKGGAVAEIMGGAYIGGAYAVRTVYGSSVPNAKDAQMSESRVRTALGKLGGTVFSVKPEDISLEISDGAAMSMAELNALRRTLCDELFSAAKVRRQLENPKIRPLEAKTPSTLKTAYFAVTENLSADIVDHFDIVFVPLDRYLDVNFKIPRVKLGIAFPPVAFDTELPTVCEKAKKAAALGCKTALISGLWQVDIAKEAGLDMVGDLRLNCFNSHSGATLAELGIKWQIISVEVPFSRAAKFSGESGFGIVVYGRLPLMTLEKCVIRDIMGLGGKHADCHFCDGGKFTVLRDRTGAKFPVCRAENHRNVIYNSVPVWMADRRRERISAGLFSHFIFTDESQREIKRILFDFDAGRVSDGIFKRI